MAKSKEDRYLVILNGASKFSSVARIKCLGTDFYLSDKYGDFIVDNEPFTKERLEREFSKIFNNVCEAKKLNGGYEIGLRVVEVIVETPDPEKVPAKKKAANETVRTERLPSEAPLATGGG